MQVSHKNVCYYCYHVSECIKHSTFAQWLRHSEHKNNEQGGNISEQHWNLGMAVILISTNKRETRPSVKTHSRNINKMLNISHDGRILHQFYSAYMYNVFS